MCPKDCAKDCAYIVEHLSVRFMELVADHSRQLAEHRAAFGARTEADAKIIAGLRAEIGASRMAVPERDSLMSERNGLLTQVQDMRAEINRLQGENATMHQDAEDGYAEAIKVLGDPIALSKERDALRAEVAALQERLRASIARGDFAQMEVAALKSQTPKHPAKVGEWVKAPLGTRGKVVSLGVDYLEVELTNGPPTRWWPVYMCEPCDQPATHDTEAGKAAAERTVRTEPVAEEIKVGDVAKVVGASGDLTAQSDIGKIGEVLKIDFGDGTVLLSGAGWVNRCDVRKVTT